MILNLRDIHPQEYPAEGESWRLGDVLYVIYQPATNTTKVGVARDPFKRMAGLQTGSPIKLELVGAYGGNREECLFAERVILQSFSHCRLMGEWLKESCVPVCVTIDDLLAQQEKA